VGNAVACGDGALRLAQRAAWREFDGELLCVVVCALALLVAATLPLFVSLAAELVFSLAVLTAQSGVVSAVLVAPVRVPLPVLLTAGVIPPTVDARDADGDDDRDDGCNGQQEPGDRGQGRPLQQSAPEERHAGIIWLGEMPGSYGWANDAAGTLRPVELAGLRAAGRDRAGGRDRASATAP
jgi:hypothetical protein